MIDPEEMEDDDEIVGFDPDDSLTWLTKTMRCFATHR